MFVQYDNRPDPPSRNHPWSIVVEQPGGQYWNFREHPSLIPEVLEDFKPWAHYSAIQQFYYLLSWLNGPDSIFETNDCALGIPSVDTKTPDVVRTVFEAYPISMHGRLTLIFRYLLFNTSRPHVDWLKRGIHDNLRDHVSNFPAVIFVGEWAHFFTEIEKEGHAVSLQFWAWGDDEAMAMENLGGIFATLLELFKHLTFSAGPASKIEVSAAPPDSVKRQRDEYW
jgi:hypothetical protein